MSTSKYTIQGTLIGIREYKGRAQAHIMIFTPVCRFNKTFWKRYIVPVELAMFLKKVDKYRLWEGRVVKAECWLKFKRRQSLIIKEFEIIAHKFECLYEEKGEVDWADARAKYYATLDKDK